MKVHQCDHAPCNKREESDPTYGSAPKGWLQLSGDLHNSGGYERPKDFCSITCAIDYLTDRAHPPVDLSAVDKAMELPPPTPLPDVNEVNVEADTL